MKATILRATFLAFFAAVFLISGCGFTPVYSSKNITQSQNMRQTLGRIEIPVIPEKTGQDFRNILMDRLHTNGRPIDPTHKLVFAGVDQTKIGLGITKDSSASRAQLRLSTTMRLIDTQTNALILKRKLNAVTSYNIQDNHFTTLVSENEARKNAIKELAEKAVIQLELSFALNTQ